MIWKVRLSPLSNNLFNKIIAMILKSFLSKLMIYLWQTLSSFSWSSLSSQIVITIITILSWSVCFSTDRYWLWKEGFACTAAPSSLLSGSKGAFWGQDLRFQADTKGLVKNKQKLRKWFHYIVDSIKVVVCYYSDGYCGLKSWKDKEEYLCNRRWILLEDKTFKTVPERFHSVQQKGGHAGESEDKLSPLIWVLPLWSQLAASSWLTLGFPSCLFHFQESCQLVPLPNK